MFEDYLKDAASHLKYYFSQSSSTSRTSSDKDSTFSSFLRIEISIKVVSAILDKKIDEIFHLYSKNQEKFFETPKDKNSKPSFGSESSLKFEPSSCYSKINPHFACQLAEDKFEIDHHFRCQLLEKDPHDDII